MRFIPLSTLRPIHWVLMFGAVQIGSGMIIAQSVRGQETVPSLEASPAEEPSREPNPFDPPPPRPDEEPKPPRPELDQEMRILLAPHDIMGGAPKNLPTVTPEKADRVRLLYMERLDPKDTYERNAVLRSVSFLIDEMADFDREGLPYDRDAYVESILRKLPKDHPFDVLGGVERLARLKHPEVENYLESLLDYDFELVRNAARKALLAMDPERASVAVVTVDDMTGSSSESDQIAEKPGWQSHWLQWGIVVAGVVLGVYVVVKARRC